LARIVAFYQSQRERFANGQIPASTVAGPGGESKNTVESAAWTAVARAILNLDEVVTRG
jgi:hypothetical protein